MEKDEAKTEAPIDDLYSDNNKLIKKISENTTQQRAKEWVNNVLYNLPEFVATTELEELHGSAQDRIVVCCAAGPSLHKQLPLLKRIQKKVVVVACNTSYGPLYKAGIYPDYTLCIESKNVSQMFKGLPLVGTFVRSLESGPALSQLNFPRTIIWGNSTGIYSDWLRYELREKITIDGGGSVGCAMFSFGFMLSPGKIILIGQDLAYTGGQLYSKDSKYQNEGTVLFDQQKGLIYQALKPGINPPTGGATHFKGRMGCVMAWHSGKRPPACPKCHNKDSECRYCNGSFYKCEYTSESFMFFLNWFISARGVIHERNPALPMCNCTEGGAYISGFHHCKFKGAVRGIRKIFRDKPDYLSSILPTRIWRREYFIDNLEDLLTALRDPSVTTICLLKHYKLYFYYTTVVHKQDRREPLDEEKITEDMSEALIYARVELANTIECCLKIL